MCAALIFAGIFAGVSLATQNSADYKAVKLKYERGLQTLARYSGIPGICGNVFDEYITSYEPMQRYHRIINNSYILSALCLIIAIQPFTQVCKIKTRKKTDLPHSPRGFLGG